MTISRNRILATFDHRESDCIPVDMGGHRSSGISAIAYAKLKKALGITAGDIYVYDTMQQLAIVEPEVQDALGIDTIELGQAFLKKTSDWKDWTLTDGTPAKMPAYIDARKEGDDWFVYNKITGQPRIVQRKGCLYFEHYKFPFPEYELENGIDEPFEYWLSGRNSMAPAPGNHFPMTDPRLPEYIAQAKEFRKNTTRAIVGVFGGSTIEIPQSLFGLENGFMQMCACPDEYGRLLERITDVHLLNLKTYLEAFGDIIDVILFVDDFGGQQAPLISPDMYRRYFKPCQKRMWDYVRKHSKAKVNLHSCGAIEPLLEDLIDAGLDAINPVQISCANMEPRALKQKYKGRLVFWGGGCDTRDVFPHGTPDEVRRHVAEQCAIMREGGGFVFQQVHNIMADIPPGNILAMFETVRDLNAGSLKR